MVTQNSGFAKKKKEKEENANKNLFRICRQKRAAYLRIEIINHGPDKIPDTQEKEEEEEDVKK